MCFVATNMFVVTKVFVMAAPADVKHGEWFQSRRSWKGLGVLSGVAFCEGFHCICGNNLFIVLSFPSFCFLLVGVGMNLTTKQLWALCRLCPWSSCSVLRSDQFRFSVGIPCVVFSSDFQWGSLVLCAFVASWAFLFHILILHSFSVNVILWLNVLP